MAADDILNALLLIGIVRLTRAQEQVDLVAAELDYRDGTLAFAVHDDGPGFDPTAVGESGTGLVALADRVGAVGGVVVVGA